MRTACATIVIAASACGRSDPPPPAPVVVASASSTPTFSSVNVAPSASSSSFASASASSTPPPTHPMRAQDWDVAIGKWHFEDDGTAWCECKATSSLIYWKGSRPKDFDASVDVMFLGAESSAGILFRERGEEFYDEATFYQFEWYARGSHHDKRLSLMRKNPYWVQIVEPKTPVAPYDKWFRMRVRAEGDHLQTFIDGELAFDKHDPTFIREGRVGIHVFQPKKALFRDFVITAL